MKKKPDGEKRRNNPIVGYPTTVELEIIHRAVAKTGDTLSHFVAMATLEAAKETLGIVEARPE